MNIKHRKYAVQDISSPVREGRTQQRASEGETSPSKKDLAGGYKDWNQVGTELGMSLVTSSIGGAFGAAGAAVKGVGGVAGVAVRTGLTAAEKTATKAATALVASGGDWSKVKDSFDDFEDWGGIVADTAGSFVTNTMGAFNSFDANGNLLNDKTFSMGSVGKLNSLGGGLVSSALNYGLTGETTLNVLNLADLGGGYNVGLLEVTLSKKNGISSRFGTGGLDVSASGIKTAYSGYKESSKIVDYKYGSLEQKSTLNAVNMMGWSGSGAAEVISKDIWDGKINVKYEKLAYDENNKVYGYHDAKEGKTITLNSSLLGGGTEESAKLGAVMTHEGVHANGDRIEAHAHLAALEMYSGVTEKFGLEGDGAFSREMLVGINNPANWNPNEGDRDYYKVISRQNGIATVIPEYDKDGHLIPDLTIEYQYENGDIIKSRTISVDNLGQAGTLGEIVGLERAQELFNGVSLDNAGLYTDQTLKDVLKMSETEIYNARKSGQIDISGLDQSTMYMLVGEALLYHSGADYNYDKKMWYDKKTGGELTSLSVCGEPITLSDTPLTGALNVQKVNGVYEYTTIQEEINRNIFTYFVMKEDFGRRSEYVGLDSITVHQYDLNGNEILPETPGANVFTGWTTVQSMPSVENNKDQNVEIKREDFYMDAEITLGSWYNGESETVLKSLVGPETVAEGFVAYTISTWTGKENKLLGLKPGDTYLYASGGTNINGDSISAFGYTALDSYARLLQHIAQNGGNTGCLVTNDHSFPAYTNYLRNDLGLKDNTTVFGNISNVTTYIPSIKKDLYVTPYTEVSQYPKEPSFYRPMVNLKKRKGTK